MTEEFIEGEKGHSKVLNTEGLRKPTTMAESRVTTKVRFGGAQINVAHDVETNVATIKKAIDWAEENNVDYLVTPEAALSGYYANFADPPEKVNKLLLAEREVVGYAASKTIGLCLGTMWVEKESNGFLHRDQIRYYNPAGNFEGAYNKVQCIAADNVVPGSYLPAGSGIFGTEEYWGHPANYLMCPKFPQGKFVVGSLICNDAYGENNQGESIARRALYSYHNRDNPAQLVVHATYGFRGKEIDENLDPDILEAIRDWHKRHIQQLSYFCNMNFIVVDASSNFGGIPSKYDTCTPSGVVINGKYETIAPSHGEQFFYYDFQVDLCPSKEINLGVDLDALDMLEKRNPKPKED